MHRLKALTALDSDTIVSKYSTMYQRVSSKRTENAFERMAISVLETEIKKRHIRDVLNKITTPTNASVVDLNEEASVAIVQSLRDGFGGIEELIENAVISAQSKLSLKLKTVCLTEKDKRLKNQKHFKNKRQQRKNYDHTQSYLDVHEGNWVLIRCVINRIKVRVIADVWDKCV